MINFLPEVSTPNIGSDISKFIEIIDLNQFFKNHLPLTSEDKNRDKMYLSMKKANQDKIKFSNELDFIKSQNIKVSFYNLNDENIKRVHQIINKMQSIINLTTKRVSVVFLERELKKKWKFVISAKDKYGTHGIISFIYGSISNTSINIDNWVLSCRVFNKYIENSIIYFISNLLSKKSNISKINTPINFYNQKMVYL